MSTAEKSGKKGTAKKQRNPYLRIKCGDADELRALAQCHHFDIQYHIHNALCRAREQLIQELGITGTEAISMTKAQRARYRKRMEELHYWLCLKDSRRGFDTPPSLDDEELTTARRWVVQHSCHTEISTVAANLPDRTRPSNRPPAQEPSMKHKLIALLAPLSSSERRRIAVDLIEVVNAVLPRDK